MPIDQAEFMEQMMALLGTASPDPGPVAPDESLLRPPMAALNTAPRTFAEVYGPQGRLLAELRARATVDGETGMATLLAGLEKGLQDRTLEPVAAPTPAPRLTRFVYPVV